MQHQQSTGYRPIVPAPPAQQAFVPISPHHSPQTNPNPQQGVTLPPFETPPVSPFSHPMHNEYAGQAIFKLPPPLQPLTTLAMHNSHHMQPMILPSSPTSIMIQQQNSSSASQSQQSSHSRYERILPKQPGPSTSVFSIPLTSSNTSVGASSVQGVTRPTMQHHTSVIHPIVPHNQHRSSISSDEPLSSADQRELARRVSHSAIERRRRERINDKIMQLKELIPSCADQDHLHKLSILQSAIEYIQYLQGLVVTSRQREREMDSKDDDRSPEEGRLIKRSKFDRYEILPPLKPVTRKYETFNDAEKGYKHKRSSISSSSSLAPSDQMTPVKQASAEDADDDNIPSISNTTSTLSQDHEEAKALLMLSNSELTVQESKQIVTTRDSETQTSPPHEWEFSKKSEVGESPRRGMTVQQLLC